MMIRRPLPSFPGNPVPKFPGTPRPPMPPAQVDRAVFKLKDQNQDGALRLDEYLGGTAGKTLARIIKLVSAFFKADTNHDGKLSPAEYLASRHHGLPLAPPTPPRFDPLLTHLQQAKAGA